MWPFRKTTIDYLKQITRVSKKFKSKLKDNNVSKKQILNFLGILQKLSENLDKIKSETEHTYYVIEDPFGFKTKPVNTWYAAELHKQCEVAKGMLNQVKKTMENENYEYLEPLLDKLISLENELIKDYKSFIVDNSHIFKGTDSLEHNKLAKNLTYALKKDRSVLDTVSKVLSKFHATEFKFLAGGSTTVVYSISKHFVIKFVMYLDWSKKEVFPSFVIRPDYTKLLRFRYEVSNEKIVRHQIFHVNIATLFVMRKLKTSGIKKKPYATCCRFGS